MKYFFDTEFHEYETNGVDTIELISIGIVREDGRELYRVSSGFNKAAAFNNEWLRENVLTSLYADIRYPDQPETLTLRNLRDATQRFNPDHLVLRTDYQISDEVIQFVGDDPHPQFYAYYAAYDWVVFCWLFGRMIDLPEHFPMFCIDLKQMMEERGLTNEWKQEKCPDLEGEHNALVDARWNKQLFELIHAKGAK